VVRIEDYLSMADLTTHLRHSPLSAFDWHESVITLRIPAPVELRENAPRLTDRVAPPRRGDLPDRSPSLVPLNATLRFVSRITTLELLTLDRRLDKSTAYADPQPLRALPRCSRGHSIYSSIRAHPTTRGRPDSHW